MRCWAALAVAQVAHDGHALALAIALQRAHDELDRDARAVAVQDGGFIARLGATADHVDHLGALVLGHEVERRAPNDLVVRIAPPAHSGGLTSVMMPSTWKTMPSTVASRNLQPRFRLGGDALRLTEMGDVVHHHAARNDAALGVELRDQVALDPHPAAIGGLQVALVAGGPAGAAAAPSG